MHGFPKSPPQALKPAAGDAPTRGGVGWVGFGHLGGVGWVGHMLFWEGSGTVGCFVVEPRQGIKK